MTVQSGVEWRPTDWLLGWLSARGRASRPTLDRACRAIVQRLDPRALNDRPPTNQLVGPLRRFGHVEEVKAGLAVVATTFCWTRQGDRGVFVGARDRFLFDELRSRFGPGFAVSHSQSPWPLTWGLAGERQAVTETLIEFGIDAVDEPGMRLLSSLPTLEDAVTAWSDDGRPAAQFKWEVATDLEHGRWVPADGVRDDGLVRSADRGRRVWMILRGGVGHFLDSPERRAVAWWAELARLSRPRLVYHRGSGQLRVPKSILPPPVMIERPLIWSSGEPPGRDPKRRQTYAAIERERAAEVARILGLQQEDA